MNVIGSWVWARTAGCWYNQALNSPLATTCCEEATARLCYYSSATVVHSSEKIMQICKILTTLWCVYSLCILKPVSLFSRLALNPGVRLDGKIVKGAKVEVDSWEVCRASCKFQGSRGGGRQVPPFAFPPKWSPACTQTCSRGSWRNIRISLSATSECMYAHACNLIAGLVVNVSNTRHCTHI